MTTPSREDLLDRAEARFPEARQTVTAALDLAEHALAGQTRLSRDPQFTHCIEVAVVVADQGGDLDMVIVAILHDLPGHAPDLTLGQLSEQFGVGTVALLRDFRRAHLAEDLSVVQDDLDPRALKLKIADRLHNMRTIEYLPTSLQHEKAEQTRRVIAPLARRLGWHDLGDELDELSRATLHRSSVVEPHNAAVPAGRVSHGTTSSRILRLSALLLPNGCRARWIREWESELSAIEGRWARLTFAVDVALGIPTLSIVTRRSAP